MGIFEIIGGVILIIGLIFIAIGIIGLYRFSRFYEKVLVASKVDTAGTITVIFGIMIMQGANLFSLRLLLLLGIILLLGPLSTHILARSAYKSEEIR